MLTVMLLLHSLLQCSSKLFEFARRYILEGLVP